MLEVRIRKKKNPKAKHEEEKEKDLKWDILPWMLGTFSNRCLASTRQQKYWCSITIVCTHTHTAGKSNSNNNICKEFVSVSYCQTSTEVKGINKSCRARAERAADKVRLLTALKSSRSLSSLSVPKAAIRCWWCILAKSPTNMQTAETDGGTETGGDREMERQRGEEEQEEQRRRRGFLCAPGRFSSNAE